MAAETIGFVGTGRMGGPMAGRLLDAGYSLCVYDSQSEATKALVARGGGSGAGRGSSVALLLAEARGACPMQGCARRSVQPSHTVHVKIA